jgi:hypothetical protein
VSVGYWRKLSEQPGFLSFWGGERPILALAISITLGQQPLSETVMSRREFPWNRTRGDRWCSGQRISRSFSCVACLNCSTRTRSKSGKTTWKHFTTKLFQTKSRILLSEIPIRTVPAMAGRSSGPRSASRKAGSTIPRWGRSTIFPGAGQGAHRTLGPF